MSQKETRPHGHPLGGYGVRDRMRIVRAVEKGREVREPRLAGAAIAYARWLQTPARRGSLTWSLSWAELGRVSALAVGLAIVLLLRSRDIAVIVVGGTALFVAMLLLSRRARSKRVERARAAEEANATLMNGRHGSPSACQ